jgi:hypothetical protein
MPPQVIAVGVHHHRDTKFRDARSWSMSKDSDVTMDGCAVLTDGGRGRWEPGSAASVDLTTVTLAQPPTIYEMRAERTGYLRDRPAAARRALGMGVAGVASLPVVGAGGAVVSDLRHGDAIRHPPRPVCGWPCAHRYRNNHARRPTSVPSNSEDQAEGTPAPPPRYLAECRTRWSHLGLASC